MWAYKFTISKNRAKSVNSPEGNQLQLNQTTIKQHCTSKSNLIFVSFKLPRPIHSDRKRGFFCFIFKALKWWVFFFFRFSFQSYCEAQVGFYPAWPPACWHPSLGHHMLRKGWGQRTLASQLSGTFRCAIKIIHHFYWMKQEVWGLLPRITQQMRGRLKI